MAVDDAFRSEMTAGYALNEPAIVLGSRGGDGGNSGGTGATGSKHIEVAKVVDVAGKALPEFQTSAGDPAIGERAPLRGAR